ncbi:MULTISPECIES: response regulator transcription factor [unclassified Sphingomonas]|uniref:LuxR C-terminal-related transcriptional regulator n=1 Tax=unclassified Sphingomonas TaxID=196159 RepID=UPI0021518DD7|nr:MULTISPECIES: response regulator transcription factor [unclassified Sphingomonas]MCR5871218.1 response regulator transcription factor [Sphingomonas sp. J344]UUY00472.1 response regulator transcription factor [Sphingomonas sp. J315]
MTTLVCDDHPLVRSALAMTLAELVDAPVLTAANFADAWVLAESCRDLSLCVVDLHMPGTGASEGLRGLKMRAPAARIVVITGSQSDEDLLTALSIGVDGFVPKTVEPGVVEAALRLVLAGGRYLPDRVAALATGDAPPACEADMPPPATNMPSFERLSQRHVDVLDQLARGRSNKEIARLLGLSPATIKSHLAHIFAVLGAANRTEAVARARDRGLV